LQKQNNAHQPKKENGPFNDRDAKESSLICASTIKIKHAGAEGEQAKNAYPDIICWIKAKKSKDKVRDE